jgi:hypothetical protein
MKAPADQTLHLLREFRQEFSAYHKEFGEFRTRTEENFAELVRLFAGESVLARYAAADVEKRLESLEKRVSVLEEH